MEEMILTKRRFYELFHKGELGNHGPMWNNYVEYLASGYTGKIAIRSRKPGGRCDYWIEPENVLQICNDRVQSGEKAENMQFSAMAPDDKLKLQGYLMRSVSYYDLYYNDVPGFAMRDGLEKHGKYLQGLQAKLLVQRSCDPTSFDWIQHLFERFPNAVIEFACYDINFGVLPHLNTIIWEVRNY